ncbi:MAG TPA: lysine-2,3-aminomutase-like protein [Xanthobacteraceae bacterium]|jgi:lysine 2,3-aminomutase|nr:lysine-2,3-aminomutase-like protein [Xanthobacteraceae bacterium]
MTSSRTLHRPADLVGAGLASPERLADLERVAARYAVAITPAMAALIDRADPHDPIARQFVPDPAELDGQPDEAADPIGDEAHSPVEGLVHRYPDRVLLKLVNVCAVYCRFCFRREMIGPGKPNALSQGALAAALAYIAAHRDVWEVILSGGDPLVLSPRRLAAVMKRIGAIEHVKIVRVHTRVPAVDPARITPALVRALNGSGKTTYVVLHANHARELTPTARAACGRIIDAGVPMLAQSVLLKGVNDDADTLGALMRALVECRIKPYYLHHLDRAPGTAHFRTAIAHGQELMRVLRARHSGLCQPTYVIDGARGEGKVPVG